MHHREAPEEEVPGTGSAGEGRFLVRLEAEDAVTLFAALRHVAEGSQPTAHLRLAERESGVWMRLEGPMDLDDLRARVAGAVGETGRWVRLRVEDLVEETVLSEDRFDGSGRSLAHPA